MGQLPTKFLNSHFDKTGEKLMAIDEDQIQDLIMNQSLLEAQYGASINFGEMDPASLEIILSEIFGDQLTNSGQVAQQAYDYLQNNAQYRQDDTRLWKRSLSALVSLVRRTGEFGGEAELGWG